MQVISYRGGEEMKSRIKKLKWVILSLSITVLLAAGYACDGGSSGCDTTPTCNYDTCSDGSYSTTQDLSSGPSNDSGLWYPNGTGPFPIFVWGCGGGSDPSAYVDHFNRVASWGVVVIAEVSTGTGTELTSALNWIISQNTNRLSPLYQKLNVSKVAAGGHSLGSTSTFEIASDSRLSTTIHVAGGSFDGNGPRNLRNPTAYICGADDALGATDNAERDYRNTTVPVFFTIMDNTSHTQAARQGLPAITAWLLWHLSGETQRSGDFLNSNGFFQTGMWDSQVKNW